MTEKAAKPKRNTALIPQPHGGALNVGGTPGNKGGTGAVPSVVRQQLVGSFADRVQVLERIADGEPMVRVQIPLPELVGHVSCPKCGKDLMPDNPSKAAFITVEGKQSARPGDQIKAVDIIGKYGIGEKHEITAVSPEVTERLRQTIELISSRETWQPAVLLNAMDVIWV
jgi:hypothetical protein